MAPKTKRVWKCDESAKAARKARSGRENERNAEANAKAQIEDGVDSKFEEERALIPPPTFMEKEVETSPLVKAMESGFLDDTKIFRFADYKFFVPTLLNSSNFYVSYIVRGLEGYIHSTTIDELEKSKAKTLISYFQDEDWESYHYQRATHLLHLLQAHDHHYAKKLWENAALSKEEWKAKRMEKWRLLHPLQTREMQDQIKKRTLEDNNNEEEPPTMPESGTTSSTFASKKKSKATPKPTSKGKGKDKGKGKGKGKV